MLKLEAPAMLATKFEVDQTPNFGIDTVLELFANVPLLEPVLLKTNLPPPAAAAKPLLAPYLRSSVGPNRTEMPDSRLRHEIP